MKRGVYLELGAVKSPLDRRKNRSAERISRKVLIFLLLFLSWYPGSEEKSGFDEKERVLVSALV